jgi:carbamoyltransferase
MAIEPWILGLSSSFHNGAACLLHGEQIIVAIQEERLTRRKRDRLPTDRPSLAVKYCLDAARISPRELDVIVNCTMSSFHRLEANGNPREALIPEDTDGAQRWTIPHHLGHALSAYMTSGFSEAVALVVDGGGSAGWELPESERKVARVFGSTLREHLSIYHCSEKGCFPIEKHLADMSYLRRQNHDSMMPFGSLGHMFSSVAWQIFGEYLEAGKVMALASYGTPIFPVSDFFEYRDGCFFFNTKVPDQFDFRDAWPNRAEEYKDLAASVQQALESALSQVCRSIKLLGKNLCYSGGVALNSVANHRVVSKAGFSQVHILAASEDSGPAIGAAYYGLLQVRKSPSRKLCTDYLGRSYSSSEVDSAIASLPYIDVIEAPDLLGKVADLLCEGKIVGWYYGGAEFGPRSLGHRSILCDARRANAKESLNARVKFRESFRPFAPCVLKEEMGNWFHAASSESMEFMLEVCYFKEKLPSCVPAVMHIDRTGRVQVVTEESNGRLYSLLERFFAKTGVPMLVNTSLNIMGEPIVETPSQALWLLLSTGVDFCVIEDRLVTKSRAFESVLQLVPYKTCEVKEISGKWARVAVYTHHGIYEYGRISATLAELVNQLDGVSSAEQIFSHLNSFNLQEACRMLTHLHSYSMIGFRSL